MFSIFKLRKNRGSRGWFSINEYHSKFENTTSQTYRNTVIYIRVIDSVPTIIIKERDI